jgi:hypothetical protein
MTEKTNFAWSEDKRDHRPRWGLWAPGWYSNTCLECGKHFVGDKRAKWCADCAYRDEDVALPPTDG